jgi:transcriptional regulator with XRE-family HTH domain
LIDFSQQTQYNLNKWREVEKVEKSAQVAQIAERMREALQASGKTQAELVRETGIDKSAISCYLSGRYEPKQKAMARLARALGVAEMWLWGYDMPMYRTEEQKKNDQRCALVAKMRNDAEFQSLVASLADLTPEQYASIRHLLAAFGK